MKRKLAAAALALAFAGGAFGATATTTTDAIDPNPVSDRTKDGASVTGTASTDKDNIGNFTVNQYNGGGVLTGATFSTAVSPENLRFTATSCRHCGGGAASAYRTGALDIAGIQSTGTSAPVSVTDVTGSTAQWANSDRYNINGSATTQAQLDALYGSGKAKGTVKETLSISKTDATKRTLTVDNRTTDGKHDSNPIATITYEYTSVNHANGSFNSGTADSNTLNLSFNDVLAGTSPAGAGFDLYNLVGSYGLQIKSIVYTGDALFTVGGIGTGTTNLAAGSFVSGTVGFAGSNVAGDYSGTWLITVADSAAGIGAGKNVTSTGVLTLNVGAHVVAVPEPSSYAMLLAGLGLMGGIARRRQPA